MLKSRIDDEYLAALAALGSYPAWRKFQEFLESELRELDVKMRNAEQPHLGRLQGAALTIADLISKCKAAPTNFKQREEKRSTEARNS